MAGGRGTVWVQRIVVTRRLAFKAAVLKAERAIIALMASCCDRLAIAGRAEAAAVRAMASECQGVIASFALSDAYARALNAAMRSEGCCVALRPR
jgi:hypothetical protein